MPQWPLTWKSTHVQSLIPTPVHWNNSNQNWAKSNHLLSKILWSFLCVKAFANALWRELWLQVFCTICSITYVKFPCWFSPQFHFQFFHAILLHSDVIQMYQELTHLHSLQCFPHNTFEIRIYIYRCSIIIIFKSLFFLNYFFPTGDSSVLESFCIKYLKHTFS